MNMRRMTRQGNTARSADVLLYERMAFYAEKGFDRNNE